MRDITTLGREFRRRLGAGATYAKDMPVPSDKKVFVSYTPAELHAQARCEPLKGLKS